MANPFVAVINMYWRGSRI